jgi:hypothetical protein
MSARVPADICGWHAFFTLEGKKKVALQEKATEDKIRGLEEVGHRQGE